MDSLIFVYIAIAVMAVLLAGVSLLLASRRSNAVCQTYRTQNPATHRGMFGFPCIPLFSLFPSPFNTVSFRFNDQTLSEKMVEGKFLLGDGREIQ